MAVVDSLTLSIKHVAKRGTLWIKKFTPNRATPKSCPSCFRAYLFCADGTWCRNPQTRALQQFTMTETPSTSSYLQVDAVCSVTSRPQPPLVNC